MTLPWCQNWSYAGVTDDTCPIKDHNCVPLCVLRTRGHSEKKSAGGNGRLLDRIDDTCNNGSMRKNNPRPTLTDVLRGAIERSGVTRYRIAKETGVAEGHLGRFIRGEMSIRLDKADRLAAYLGLRLVPDLDAVPPEPTPESLARPMLARPKAKGKAK
jgi:hypothetical protein